MSPTPVTIITGFLGAGKTTLINKIIKTNPERKYGLIINEFGEVGVDGQIIDANNEEIFEISDGCVCCVVRTDLVKGIEKMAKSGVDYILLETSGLAEPAPVVQSFVEVDPKVAYLDALVTLVDGQNWQTLAKEYKTIGDQIKLADILVLNKIDDMDRDQVSKLKSQLQDLNQVAGIIENREDSPIELLTENNKWDLDKLLTIKDESGHHEPEGRVHDEHCGHNHSDSHEHKHEHNHEHDQVDEVVFSTTKTLDPNKMDAWLYNDFPPQAIRSKGILILQTPAGLQSFLFQMVGANKSLVPMSQLTKKTADKSVIVLIGKNLDKAKIITQLEKCTV